MGSNLPPGVSISDSDAPWNKNSPEPLCVRCGSLLDHGSQYDKRWYCPKCEREWSEEKTEERYK